MRRADHVLHGVERFLGSGEAGEKIQNSPKRDRIGIVLSGRGMKI